MRQSRTLRVTPTWRRCQVAHHMAATAARRLPHAPALLLDDVDLPTFIALLRYIYTDQLPPPYELDVLVVSLLAVAQRLAMARLAALCARHLQANLCVDTAATTLELADTLSSPW